jgi:hypothetical protein
MGLSGILWPESTSATDNSTLPIPARTLPGTRQQKHNNFSGLPTQQHQNALNKKTARLELLEDKVELTVNGS